MDLPFETARDFMNIVNFQVVVVVNDSPSMQANWREVRQRLDELVDILILVGDNEGFTLKFLNSMPQGGDRVLIRTRMDLDACFRWASPRPGPPDPMGNPMPPTVRLTQVAGQDLSGAGLTPAQKGRLLLIFTDGAPDPNFAQLHTAIQGKQHGRVFVGFMMCTRDDRAVTQYNQTMDPIPGVDVNDDYVSEMQEWQSGSYSGKKGKKQKKQKKQKKGKNGSGGGGRQLTPEMYLVKCILGPLDPKYDDMDSPWSLYNSRYNVHSRSGGNISTGYGGMSAGHGNQSRPPTQPAYHSTQPSHTTHRTTGRTNHKQDKQGSCTVM